jgi:hypothetical protein
MPQQDWTRDALDQVEKTIGKLQVSFQARIPYGPRTVIKSNLQKRLDIQNQSPEQTIAMRNKMGPEQWDAYMKELYRGN